MSVSLSGPASYSPSVAQAAGPAVSFGSIA
jgi:hypothetical protein